MYRQARSRCHEEILFTHFVGVGVDGERVESFYAPQTKILEGRMNILERIFKALFQMNVAEIEDSRM